MRFMPSMIEPWHVYDARVAGSDGARYVARAYASRRRDGTWEAWFVFFRLPRGEAVLTGAETTQSCWDNLAYWASGISPVYLEGALRRALDRSPEAQLQSLAEWAGWT